LFFVDLKKKDNKFEIKNNKNLLIEIITFFETQFKKFEIKDEGKFNYIIKSFDFSVLKNFGVKENTFKKYLNKSFEKRFSFIDSQNYNRNFEDLNLKSVIIFFEEIKKIINI